MLAGAAFGVTVPAQAQNPLNSKDTTALQAPSGRKRDEPHTTVNVVPVVGGTTDIGFGGGAFLGVARIEKGYQPYRWNLEAAGMITFRPGDHGAVETPFQDFYAKLTVPRFLDAPVRLELRPSFTWEQLLGYYGVGNASSADVPPGAPADYFRYQRIHPQFEAAIRWRIVDHVAGRIGARYTQNWIEVAPGSKLELDGRSGDPTLERLVGKTQDHGLALFSYGSQWDDRDSETSAHSGQFHELDLRVSPGGTDAFPYRYGQVNLTMRAFIPLARPALTLALRGVGDVLVGDPPFYELSRFANTYALGGPNGVRGIPAQRYHGKVKAFGNVELRAEIVHFEALGKPLLLGAVAFFDAGRVWADTRPTPELDGTGLGLHVGTGGGLRLQSGEAFVLRLDVAWSPDANPIGGYFGVGQMF